VHGARVVVVHACDLPPEFGVDAAFASEAEDRIAAAAERELTKAAERCARSRGIEAKIVAGGASVPDGEVGEEWSRGPNTFLGYLGDPELTLKDFQPDGWYHSGDLARRLPDGSIRIVGRLKDIIVRGGQNISAREVEDYLAAHPAIHSAALVGVPHPRLGETGCAVVVVRAGKTVTLPEITDFLLAKGVARFKLPERLEVWPQLPLNPSGKVQKFLIRKALGESADKESA